MTNTTKTTSKKDQIKTAIMDFLNKKVGSVSRIEITQEIKDMGSARTISRALAELKLDGLALQQKDGKNTSWVSTEPKTKEVENDYSEVDESDSNDPVINKKKPETCLYKIKDSKIDPLACGACYHVILGYDETICPSCGIQINMDNEKSILQAAFNKLAGIKPEKLHDLSKLKKEFVSGLIDQILEKDKKKPTKKNIADVRKMLETTDFLDKLKIEAKKTADKKKKITKKDLVKAAKVTRNSSTSGKAKDKAKDKAKKGAKKAGKKVGVIATIIKAITKKHASKKQILAKLVKAFPEREADKMMKTINVQVPSRLRKDKNLNIEKTDKGYKII